MKRFEYRTQIWDAIPLEGLLNVEGQSGWELVAVVQHKEQLGCFYRREIPRKRRKRKC